MTSGERGVLSAENFMIGISSRALFDLEEENAIFESQGWRLMWIIRSHMKKKF